MRAQHFRFGSLKSGGPSGRVGAYVSGKGKQKDEIRVFHDGYWRGRPYVMRKIEIK